jgi:hypothetical protein
MIKPVTVVGCVFLSYFVVVWIFFGYWGQALMMSIYATAIFSTTLLAASCFSNGRPWRAFWIANVVLILIFGGLELYALLTITDSHTTRFGGYRLSVDGHITVAGFASLTFDIAMCTSSNFLGFYLARVLLGRLKVE